LTGLQDLQDENSPYKQVKILAILLILSENGRNGNSVFQN